MFIMNLTDFLIAILATWRITNPIVDDSEDGPFDVLHFIRYLIGVRYRDGIVTYKLEEGTELGFWGSLHFELYKALTCFWCASLWIGLICTLIILIPNNIGIYILLPFSLSGGALMVKRYLKE